MAKTAIEQPIEGDTLIFCPFYEGLKSKMPQEAKDKMKAEKPEAYKMVFGEIEPTEVTEVVVDPIVTE